MALAWELNEHERNVASFEEEVEEVKKKRDQSLLLAQAQLAVIATSAESRGLPLDITERTDFSPENPSRSLTEAELANFDGAGLVVSALSTYVKSLDRLDHAEYPRGIAPGTV